MKRVLFIIAFLCNTISFSQDTSLVSYWSTFDTEWYDKLDSPLEYIVYKNIETDLYSVRVYRGDSEEHYVLIKDQYGEIVYTEIIGREEEIDLSFLPCGNYIIEIKNKNSISSQILAVK